VCWCPPPLPPPSPALSSNPASPGGSALAKGMWVRIPSTQSKAAVGARRGVSGAGARWQICGAMVPPTHTTRPSLPSAHGSVPTRPLQAPPTATTSWSSSVMAELARKRARRRPEVDAEQRHSSSLGPDSRSMVVDLGVETMSGGGSGCASPPSLPHLILRRRGG
jgi:hypothetical protein